MMRKPNTPPPPHPILDAFSKFVARYEESHAFWTIISGVSTSVLSDLGTAIIEQHFKPRSKTPVPEDRLHEVICLSQRYNFWVNMVEFDFGSGVGDLKGIDRVDLLQRSSVLLLMYSKQVCDGSTKHSKRLVMHLAQMGLVKRSSDILSMETFLLRECLASAIAARYIISLATDVQDPTKESVDLLRNFGCRLLRFSVMCLELVNQRAQAQQPRVEESSQPMTILQKGELESLLYWSWSFDRMANINTFSSTGVSASSGYAASAGFVQDGYFLVAEENHKSMIWHSLSHTETYHITLMRRWAGNMASTDVVDMAGSTGSAGSGEMIPPQTLLQHLRSLLENACKPSQWPRVRSDFGDQAACLVGALALLLSSMSEPDRTAGTTLLNLCAGEFMMLAQSRVGDEKRAGDIV